MAGDGGGCAAAPGAGACLPFRVAEARARWPGTVAAGALLQPAPAGNRLGYPEIVVLTDAGVQSSSPAPGAGGWQAGWD